MTASAGRLGAIDPLPSPLMSYEEAATVLGIGRDAVKQLVKRGHLRSEPDPSDRRYRRVRRSEVMAYARSHAGKWGYSPTLGEPWQDELRRYVAEGVAADTPDRESVTPAPPHAPTYLHPADTEQPHAAPPPFSLNIDPELAAIGASVGLVGLLLLVLAREADGAQRVLILAALAALGVLLFAEWQRQGKITEADRRRLEMLARRVDADPDPFVNELSRQMGA